MPSDDLTEYCLLYWVSSFLFFRKEGNGTQSNGNGTQSNGIGNNVKEECLDNGKGEESVSGVMESAIDSSDVRPDKLVPVDFMSAMATGPPQSNGESFDRSVSRRSGGKSIPGVEFAAAVALNNKHGETNGHATKPRERTLSNGSISFEVKPSETSTSSPTPLISWRTGNSENEDADWDHLSQCYVIDFLFLRSCALMAFSSDLKLDITHNAEP